MKTLLSALLVTLALSAQAQITSTFDTDADGWLFYNASNVSNAVNFNSTSGNPGGYISATYSSNQNSSFQFWLAPSKFHGNHLALSLGLKFKFDLQQSVAGTGASFDVRIKNGSAYIYISGLTPKPAVAPAWTSYSFALDETGGWFYSAGAVVATRSQVMGILTNVTGIEIRGTYASNASYTSGLDNVILEQRILTPAPVASSLSATSGKPGDVITITGSGFNTTASNNVVSFGVYAGTKAVVQSATATQLQVVVPQGAVYGPITITNTATGLSSKTLTPFNPVFDGGGRIIPASFRDRFTISTIPIQGWFVGDIDGDGWEDFGVANNSTVNVVDIYRNMGLGGALSSASFAAKVSVAIPKLGGGLNFAGLWFADLDGDGKLDAVSSNTSGAGAAFVTLRNISTPGSITFEAPEYWPGGSDETPISLVADLDGDGRPELLSGESSLSSTAFSYFWINQNLSTPGNIEFGGPIFPFNGTVVNGFAGSNAGDLNGDGKNELIISGFNQGQSFAVLQNVSTPGVPAFQNAFTLLTNQYFGPSHVIDMNLDGKNDLVYKISGEASFHIRLNSDTDGTLTAADFTSDIIVAGDLSIYGGISIADVNGDGKADIAATDDIDFGVYENVFSGGVFDVNSLVPAFQILGAGSNSGSPLVSDLNRDGKPDFVIAGSASITIVQNKNVSAPYISLNTVSPLSAPVGATVTITGNNFSSVSTDNEVWFGAVRATVLTATPTQLTVSVPPGAAYRPVSVRKGELTSSYHLPFATSFSSGVTFNSTHFAPPVTYTLTGADYDIEVGDLDLDGKPDVVAEGSGLISRIYRNTHASGSISTASLTAAGTTATTSGNAKLVDVDGDGKQEIVSAYGRTYPNQSTVGSISFGTEINTASADNVSFGDLNLDGKVDLAFASASSGPAQLLLQENRSNVGAFVTSGTYGTFTSSIIYGKPSAGGDVAIADFDNDGFRDVIALNPATDNMSIFRNAQKFRVNTTLFDPRVDVAVGDNPLRAYTADFDKDGKIDLLISHWTGTSTTLLIVFQNTSTVGTISFNRIDLTNPSVATIATVADLDGDGKPEILTTSESGNRFSIFKNLHTSGALTAASFAAPFNTTVTAPRGITTGDLNLDGKPEIIITRAANLLVVYENLISSLSPPTITSFTPTSGPIGITVTINGTNFDTTPANNTVTFNGTTAVVTASTATSITTTVPAGATTGKISVTVGGNTATSTNDFTVTTASSLTITSFTPPSGPVNTTVTITGTNFSATPANNTVKFNGTTAVVTASTATSITTTVPTGATTGKISVTVAGNTATSATDFTVTTSGGVVTITTKPLATKIGGIITLDLVPLIKTANNNLDLASLAIVTPPTSGGKASINSSGVLSIDYTGLNFSGIESIVIKACDLGGNCAQQNFSITVSDTGPSNEIIVYNAVSPDGQNPILRLEFIDTLSPKNQVSIYNRWGDGVFCFGL
jgi:large repetitive protein